MKSFEKLTDKTYHKATFGLFLRAAISVKRRVTVNHFLPYLAVSLLVNKDVKDAFIFIQPLVNFSTNFSTINNESCAISRRVVSSLRG